MKDTMTIVVVSDNHGDKTTLEHILRHHQKADLFLHCGDSQLTPADLSSFIAIQGNCDWPGFYAESRRLKTRWGDIFIEHGLKFLKHGTSYVSAQHALIYLYGHTHCHRIERLEDGTFLANPGSTSRPRDGSQGTYLIITLGRGEPQFDFRTVDLDII